MLFVLVLAGICFFSLEKKKKTRQNKLSNSLDTNTDFFSCVIYTCAWGCRSPCKQKKRVEIVQHQTPVGLNSVTELRKLKKDGPVFHHSYLRWPFRCRLKESVPLLISDAEGTSSQPATGGTHRRAEFESRSDTRVQLKQPQRPSGVAAADVFCCILCSGCEVEAHLAATVNKESFPNLFMSISLNREIT